MSEHFKQLIDLTSVGTFVAYLFSFLPQIALVFTVLWSIFRFLETKAFQAIVFKLFGWHVADWLHVPSRKEIKSESTG